MAFILEFFFAFYFVNINKLFVGDFLEVVLSLSQFHPKKKLSQFRVLLYMYYINILLQQRLVSAY